MNEIDDDDVRVMICATIYILQRGSLRKEPRIQTDISVDEFKRSILVNITLLLLSSLYF